MGTVIYEANPIQAFLGSFEAILVFLLIGLFGIGTAFLRRNQRPAVHMFIGGLGALLLIVGCVLTLITLGSIYGGSHTMTAQFDNKTIAQQSCGDNGETCPHYVLSPTTSANTYDFDVPQKAYTKVRLNVCYKVTYYATTDLFGQGSYQRIDSSSASKPLTRPHVNSLIKNSLCDFQRGNLVSCAIMSDSLPAASHRRWQI